MIRLLRGDDAAWASAAAARTATQPFPSAVAPAVESRRVEAWLGFEGTGWSAIMRRRLIERSPQSERVTLSLFW